MKSIVSSDVWSTVKCAAVSRISCSGSPLASLWKGLPALVIQIIEIKLRLHMLPGKK